MTSAAMQERIDRRPRHRHSFRTMKTAALILALLTFAPATLTVQAETLAEMAASAGTDWMIGSWATEDGNVSIAYTWKLDKHAVGVSFKMGDREAEGMIVLKPGTKDVIYHAVDNQGGLISGKWQGFHDNPTLFSTLTKEDGTESKTAVEHIKTDDDTMTVKLYRIGSDGNPEESESRTVVFKRKK
jgi:hypothetical protein